MSILGACIVIAISACIGACIPPIMGWIMIKIEERKEKKNEDSN